MSDSDSPLHPTVRSYYNDIVCDRPREKPVTTGNSSISYRVATRSQDQCNTSIGALRGFTSNGTSSNEQNLLPPAEKGDFKKFRRSLTYGIWKLEWHAVNPKTPSNKSCRKPNLRKRLSVIPGNRRVDQTKYPRLPEPQGDHRRGQRHAVTCVSITRPQ